MRRLGFNGLIEAPLRSTTVNEFTLDGEVITSNDRFPDAMGFRLGQINGRHHRICCEPEEYNSQGYRGF